jgi:outer membrane protein assembly factor BamB
VAAEDEIYVQLGIPAPIVALDARTGEVRRTCEGTEACRGFVLHEKLLLCTIDEEDGRAKLLALDADTGRTRWKSRSHSALRDYSFNVEPSVYGDRLCYLCADGLLCLNARTGDQCWRVKHDKMPDGKSPLILTEDVILATSGKATTHQHHTKPDARELTLHAYSAANGKPLWSYACSAFYTHGDPWNVFVVGDTVWTHGTAFDLVALDLATGAEQRIIPAARMFNTPNHPRCYPERITERWYLGNQRGIEAIGLETDEKIANNWVRSTCQLGIIPANGLIYAGPHWCNCYRAIILEGMNALAPRESKAPAEVSPSDPSRLERGPAFGRADEGTASPLDKSDWPQYRRDARRSGATSTSVGSNLAVAWQTQLGRPLSAPTVADGLALVASVDAHEIVGLDATTGRERWRFTAGGRIDSPPATHDGMALFGCADGCVYALRQTDGSLAWRFRAAPSDRWITENGQVASTWPVRGSVLVADGRVYCVAGRQTYIDGGMRLYALDPLTGRILHEQPLQNRYEIPPKADNWEPYNRSGAKNDILLSENGFVYLMGKAFDANLVPSEKVIRSRMVGERVRYEVEELASNEPRLLPTSGFLDGNYFHRNEWFYKGIKGQLLAVAAETVYGVKVFDRRDLSTSFIPGSGYLLFAEAIEGKRAGDVRSNIEDRIENSRPHPLPTYKWHLRLPLRPRGMVLAGDTLFVAGPPDKVDSTRPYATFDGQSTASLWAVAARDGRKLAETPLPSPPVWDGMATAGGRLFAALADGSVVCLQDVEGDGEVVAIRE